MLSIGVISPGQSGLLISHGTVAANLLLSFSVFNLEHQQAMLCQYSQLVSSAFLVPSVLAWIIDAVFPTPSFVQFIRFDSSFLCLFWFHKCTYEYLPKKGLMKKNQIYKFHISKYPSFLLLTDGLSRYRNPQLLSCIILLQFPGVVN